MTEPAPPPPPLTSTDRVLRMLPSLTDTDRPAVDDVVAAVCAVVPRWLSRNAAGEWDPAHVHGATMLAARLWRRRHSPAGVETFGAEGAAYVQRTDPDVALLLGMGHYAAPVVG